MVRESIEPSVPIPDLVLNMIISDSPTWIIANTLRGLAITYDGHETWFNIPRFGVEGVSVEKKPTIVDVGTSSSSLTFKSGGTIYVGKVMSIPGINPRVEKINITYQDNVSIFSSSPETLSATISINLSGKYFVEGAESGSLEDRKIDPLRATITYSGKRQ
jgi:hypothetical protein